MVSQQDVLFGASDNTSSIWKRVRLKVRFERERLQEEGGAALLRVARALAAGARLLLKSLVGTNSCSSSEEETTCCCSCSRCCFRCCFRATTAESRSFRESQAARVRGRLLVGANLANPTHMVDKLRQLYLMYEVALFGEVDKVCLCTYVGMYVLGWLGDDYFFPPSPIPLPRLLPAKSRSRRRSSSRVAAPRRISGF